MEVDTESATLSSSILLTRARLRYFSRVVRNKPSAFLSLLFGSLVSHTAQWVKLVFEDICTLQRRAIIMSWLLDLAESLVDSNRDTKEDSRSWSCVVAKL